ncbi:GNAT family N-acetyltransferase [Companilactobacillus hulinensis]|uniref:GNAT family N-acetyltransferase n=1 Tax=Companilactobacillus hulinensis TaxID=2486007 RepID=UPI0013DDE49B|nr:GNAT family N-acetyltransferase [Companilactobacillus hulinensis]
MGKNINLMPIRISMIDDINLLNSFDCGDPRLNEFLVYEAMNLDIENCISTTLLIKNNVIVGFFSTSSSLLLVEHSSCYVKPPASRETMREFSAVKIQYFAIDKKYQSLGFGRSMMSYLLHKLLELDRVFNLGCKVIYLEALTNAMDFYEIMGFEYLQPWDADNSSLSSALMLITHDELFHYVEK